MHPDDAARRHVAEDDMVVITTNAGSVEAPVEISDEMMPGVVSLPHGWGHGTRAGVGWRHAAATAGVSVNDITDASRFDPVSGNAAVTALPVAVVKAT